MELEVKIEEVIPKPVEEVFDAIIDADKMSNYFISSADSPMIEGKKITWIFEDVGAKVDILVKKIVNEKLIVFEWTASGVITEVMIETETMTANKTSIKIIESGWEMDHEGVQRALQQSQGWTDFLCCLKAFLLFNVNLRLGKPVN